jgi:long-chain acyl-CoA synthetase
MMFQLLTESCDQADLSSVNYCFSAAATLPVQAGQRWHEKFGLPIHEGYGLTETSPFASYNHRDRFTAGSIGTPIDGVEIRVVDSETAEECPPGELGEIIIRGPNVMLGYWNREEETQAAIRDGWFHSGDIGRQDEDGFLYIVDRVKDMIAVGGLKVFPAEVERVLLDHPMVAQAAVVGFPDEVFGEQVVAFVVLDSESESGVVDSISKYAKANLANYKVPRTVIPIDELPRNPSGKILKRRLREPDFAGSGRQSPESTASGKEEHQPTVSAYVPVLRSRLEQTYPTNRQSVVTEFLCSLVQTVADLDDPPGPDERFLDVGLDSLMIVEVSNQLQAELGPDQEIRATLVFDYPRISDLAGFLLSAIMSEEETSREVTTKQSSTTDKDSDLRSEIESMSEDEALAELMRELD